MSENKAAHVLKAFGFTPRTLSRALGVSTHVARSLLDPKRVIYISDAGSLLRLMHGCTTELLFDGAEYVYGREGVQTA